MGRKHAAQPDIRFKENGGLDEASDSKGLHVRVMYFKHDVDGEEVRVSVVVASKAKQGTDAMSDEVKSWLESL